MKFRMPEAGFPSQFMKPWPFFIGVMLGFAASCYAGSIFTTINPFMNFHRFHYFISQHSSFYPTVNQLILLCESLAKKDQVIVLVAGDSIFNGMGQSEDELWTRSLQNDLGDKYCVVNFAFHGVYMFEAGYYVAEALAKRNRKIICVTDTQPGWVGPIEGYYLASICYSAIQRNLLFPFEVRNHMIKKDIETLSSGHDSRLAECELGCWIDSFTNAYDLWNYIGYRDFFTVWDKKTHPDFTRARQAFPDREVISVKDAFSEETMKLRAEELKARSKDFIMTKNKIGQPQTWQRFEEIVKLSVPQKMRRHTLVVMTRYNPRVLDNLTKVERETDRLTYAAANETWRQYGYHSLVVGDRFQYEDYIDSNHFSAQGGKQLALEVSEAVKEIARIIGYK